MVRSNPCRVEELQDLGFLDHVHELNWQVGRSEVCPANPNYAEGLPTTL
jgi:hypothetical protein